MLTRIHVKNFTIIHSLDLEIEEGFTVLTGETGAGKSIIVDAVMLALGARADSNLIRQGQDRCDISLCFSLEALPAARAWLEEHALNTEETECIIHRSLTRDGRSRSTLNGQPCPQQQIREFSELLISIHGQHQHQALLKPNMQLNQLDAYAKHEVHLEKSAGLYQHWKELSESLESLEEHSKNSEAQLSLLNYQLDELNQLSPQAGEWEELFQTHRQLHHRKKIMEHLNNALIMSSEGELSATHCLQQSLLHVQEITLIDPALNSAQELLKSAQINLQEAVDELNHYQHSLDLSPEHLAKIEQRISRYHELARKHRVEPEQLHSISEKLITQIDSLNRLESTLLEVQQQIEQVLKEYAALACALTHSRQKAAEKLTKAITASMQELGMEGGGFRVELEAISEKISPSGNERAHFKVSTNPGQSYEALQKIVSGGELSRISLALQMLSAEKDQTPTLIFDEVDVGIGGKTAAIVGELLQTLGQHKQVLCVTHLPQVAAKGHHHFKVSKLTEAQHTQSQISALNPKQRTEELARMLGGTHITQQSLAHAEEMLS